MSRVLEIVLGFPLQGWQAAVDARSRKPPRAARDFGAELVRAWRICPQVKMRRGHESVAIVPCRVIEAEPAGEGRWWTWIEVADKGRRVFAARTREFAPGVAIRECFDEHAADLRIAPAPAGVPQAAFAEGARASGDGNGDGPEAAASLVSDRRRGRWLDADGVAVDLTLDDITQPSAGGPRRFCELRVAVADSGEPAGRAAALRALFHAARELSGAWPAFLLPVGTLDRVCIGAAPETPAAPAKAKSVELSGLRTQRAALFALGASVTAQWFANHAGVRDTDEPEYVHQMRVALRRLRTLMRLFPHYADTAWKGAFAADLGWLGGLLGDVRDWDVCVTATLPDLAAADGDAAAAVAWIETQAAARAQGVAARAELQQALASARYARLVLSWLEWLSTLALPEAADAASAGKLPSLKRHAAKRVSRLFGHLYGSPKLTTLDAAARHQVRIDAKRLRYALEFFASLASRRTRGETTKLLARVQSVLGEANDAAVALHCLERLAAPSYQQGFARGYGAAAQHYAAREAENLLRGLHPPKIGGRTA
ncbi:CHAD domain-containing protein [Burkholderia alba]|uniref:CHAD domain-containing protein n=1 Tax=Burkholderia alba TaxID=2683677 RepID=UPI002B05FA14|nr:CHAD domain-containing protein [Burkholderia alba]